MNTYDVFDTLIARRYIDNTRLLKQIECEFGISDFVVQRTQADTGARDIHEIYQHLVDVGVIPSHIKTAMLEREIDLEIQHSFPIAAVMNGVKHGDMLITDMYLTAPIVLEMVRKAGLNKQVSIYQSNGDKRTGKVWNELKGYDVHHTGDNRHSDVDMPTAVGISARHWIGSPLSAAERYFVNNGMEHIALMCREIRLSAPVTYTTSDFLVMACAYNLPLIALSAELLFRKYGDRHIVFLGRDCQLLQRFYSVYYSVNCSYLPFSRKVVMADDNTAVAYLNANMPANSVLVDLNSTGTTWAKVCKRAPVDVAVMVYLDKQQYLKEPHTLPSSFDYFVINSDVRVNGLLYEVMNCADHGTLTSIKQLGHGLFKLEFADHDVPHDIVSDIHRPVAMAVELADVYRSDVRSELGVLPMERLLSIFRDVIVSMGNHTELNTHLSSFFEREVQHMNALTENKFVALANKYNSDKGTTYKCAHGYAKRYAQLFEPLVDKECKILEIGLNRDNTDTIPSLSMYKEYFRKPTLYGFDIQQGFMKFNDPQNGINIIIGDQSNPDDLRQIQGSFDIILDDGYHASKHQQISLLHLWQLVKPGGMYIIEDLHFQPDPSIETSVKTKELMRSWKIGDACGSAWISTQEARSILESVDRIEMFDSESVKWPAESVRGAVAVLYKKQ